MLRLLFLLLLLSCYQDALEAQCIGSKPTVLHANNIRTNFYADGRSFYGEQYYEPGFYPKYLPNQDNPVTISNGNLWIGAKNQQGSISFATPTQDCFTCSSFISGPIDPTTGRAYNLDDCRLLDNVWTVYSHEIVRFLEDYEDNGQIDETIPLNIKGWPARGNIYFSEIWGFELPDIELAPFLDRNQNQRYEPHLGEYPIISEEFSAVIPAQLLWTVYNDDNIAYPETGVNSLLVEVQLTAWAFQCQASDLLNNTIFTRHRIKNYNPSTLYDLRVGLSNVYHLGYYLDDYFGCDTLSNTTYYYNSDEEDGPRLEYESHGPYTPFVDNIPVQAMTFLNHDLHAVSYYYIGALCDVFTGNPPGHSQSYYRFLNALRSNGVPQLNPQGAITRFPFYDNPNRADGWSMHTTNVSTGICFYPTASSIAIDSLVTGAIIELDAAYSTHQQTGYTPLQNVNLMEVEIPLLQDFYDTGFRNGDCKPLAYCSDDCVWPGDTNLDGIVSAKDILPIGIATGQTSAGTKRTLVNAHWQPFEVKNWERKFADNINHKHADCDGNGVVQRADAAVVEFNHAKQWKNTAVVHSPSDTGMIIFRLHTNQNSYKFRDSIPIYFEVSTQGEAIYGYAVQYAFEGQLLDSQTSKIRYLSSNYLGYNDSLLAIKAMDVTKGTLELALCKTTLRNASGNARNAELLIQLDSSIHTNRPDGTLTLHIELQDALVINAQEEVLRARPDKLSILLTDVPYIEDTTTTIDEITASTFEVHLYPNPSNGALYLSSNEAIERIEFFNVQGLSKLLLLSPTANIDIPRHLSAGLYIVQLTNNAGDSVLKRMVLQ